MNLDFPIYHVIVVGFHHKRGCQVEFAYPPLEDDLEKTAWKHLPTLAMPDGAHNFDSDTVYFHLPSLKNPNETVFGVACYQQIDVSKLKNLPEDVTRSTVQKSVCVLSRFPLYGHIQVKMALVTAAYFREGDFGNYSILEEAYHNLNACLSAELLNTPEAFQGLSPRDLVFTFRHQILVLFKLLLLEKKILFRGASVGQMCSALLTLVSLVPLSVEYGLNESACVRTSRSMSVIPELSGKVEEEVDRQMTPEFISGTVTRRQNGANRKSAIIGDSAIVGDSIIASPTTTTSQATSPSEGGLKSSSSEVSFDKTSVNITLAAPVEKCEDVPDFLTAVQIAPAEAGLPLALFTNGYICHPYLSLNYMDLLMDTGVKGFVVGATNVLFKQKKDLADVIIEMQDGSIDIHCPNLKRILTLTTQDLRFAENIVRQVTQESSRRYDGDSFMDGVGWEGGDEWIRAQFKYYLMCLMRTSLVIDGGRQRDCFNSQYLEAWQSTSHWQKWRDYVTSEERNTPGIYSICAGHPNDGTVSMSDMKIRLSHTFQSTEGGRKFNQAVSNTGRAVAQTGKAVGGALFQARGAITSWWGQVTTPTSPPTGFSDSIVPESGGGQTSSKPSGDTVSDDSGFSLSKSIEQVENID